MALCERLALALRIVCSRAWCFTSACVGFYRSLVVLFKRDAPVSSPPALWAPAEGSLVGEGSGEGFPPPKLFWNGNSFYNFMLSPRLRGDFRGGQHSGLLDLTVLTDTFLGVGRGFSGGCIYPLCRSCGVRVEECVCYGEAQ